MSIKIGNKNLKSVFIGGLSVASIFLGSSQVYSSLPSADPVLANNSWTVIRQVCESGEASSFWAIGDIKVDTGTDSTSRTYRIVDMQGLYGKHVVFEQVNVEGTDGSGDTGVVWSADNVNDYLASDMNTSILPSVILKLSSELQGELTNTTVKVAENGNSSTLVDVTNKLFLEAEKEVFGSRTYSVEAEFTYLTTYEYYVTHNTAQDRIKYSADSTARGWWLRSPYSGGSSGVCRVGNYGDAYDTGASGTFRFAPCFSF